MSLENGQPKMQSNSDRFGKSRDSTEMILSLATAPFLIAVLAGEKLLELLLVTGHASEEVFRGDRLPVLNFPPTHPEAKD
jgi:hypothetical protein